jgi:hypothetical protein
MSRRDGERERLRALVQGADWAETGRIEATAPGALPVSSGPEKQENPALAGLPWSGRYWARTSDLQLVELALSQLS